MGEARRGGGGLRVRKCVAFVVVWSVLCNGLHVVANVFSS